MYHLSSFIRIFYDHKPFFSSNAQMICTKVVVYRTSVLYFIKIISKMFFTFWAAISIHIATLQQFQNKNNWDILNLIVNEVIQNEMILIYNLLLINKEIIGTKIAVLNVEHRHARHFPLCLVLGSFGLSTKRPCTIMLFHRCWWWHHHQHWCHHRLCTPPPATGLDIEISYLVDICKYVPHVCTSNI